ncbi:hypothetical protein MNB_SUP05-5-152 [hydrothermal vent metagenome]|uniref:Uncharacterized protein n=1 Tax=hydrothermal vent metagenome TaxID=652676 RepID=A0A1W1BIH6_9ZZZZ
MGVFAKRICPRNKNKTPLSTTNFSSNITFSSTSTSAPTEIRASANALLEASKQNNIKKMCLILKINLKNINITLLFSQDSYVFYE